MNYFNVIFINFCYIKNKFLLILNFILIEWGIGEITAICLFDEKCLMSAQGIPQTEDIEDYDEDDLLQFLVFYEN